MRLYFAFSAVLLFSAAAHAQKPVLSWAARAGADIDFITGTAIGVDGSVYFVAVTTSGTDNLKPNFRNSQILTGKLSSDGTIACSATVGGSFDDTAIAMALFPDGTLLVGGNTQSSDFPRVPNRGPTASEEIGSFLMRISPCDGSIRYSTYLPAGLFPSVAAIAADESVYVGAYKSNSGDTGALVRFNAQGSQILSQTALRGIPLALILDSAGGVFTTGMLPPVQSNGTSQRLAFLTHHTHDLQSIVYDLTLGESSAMVGTVLYSAGDSLYVGGFGTRPGETLYNLAYSGESYVPNFQNGSAWLARIWPDGSVAFRSFVDIASLASSDAYRRPVGLGAGPDARIWMAITGPTAFPRTMLQGVELDGVLLSSFNPDGTPAGGETLIPGLRPYSVRPVVAFSSSGRIAELSLNPYLPTTTGSFASGPLSAVVFELAVATTAPEVIADREILDIDQVSVPGTPYLNSNPKPVGVQLSDGSHGDFVAATVLDASRGFTSDPPAFSIAGDSAGQVPASVLVARANPPQNSINNAALVVLTPGAQGTVAIPVRLRQFTAGLQVQAIDAWQLPAPSSDLTTFRLSISTEGLNAKLNLPFQITHQTPWLRLETSEGVTPAVLNAVVDPTGLASGTYPITFTVQVGGGVVQRTLTLTIGPVLPVLQVSPIYGLIDTAVGTVRTVVLTISSSSTPIDFTLESLSAALDGSPKQGTTPQEIVATFNPAGMAVDQITSQSFIIHANGQQYLYPLLFRLRSFVPPMPDAPPAQASPGSLITFIAGKSQCDPVAFTSGPWRTQLGGCTLRVNGTAIPVASIEKLDTPPPLPDSRYRILAQVPYDLEGPATLEIEDKTGSKNAFSLTVKPVLPTPRDLSQFVALTGRVGDQVVLRMTGLGVTVTPAPLGDLPTDSIVPVAPVEVFVGGRKAHLLSVELSRTEVATFDVLFEIPEIAPDLHDLSLSVGDTLVSIGTLVVTPLAPPGTPLLIAPENGATGTSTSPTLSWNATSDATSYDVYFGVNATFQPFAINTTSLQYAPGPIAPGRTYYWWVNARNASGNMSSEVRSFTTSGTLAASSAGIFRSGYFWLQDVDGDRQFNSPPDRAFAFGGVPGDIPISGDWNGSGTTKVGVYRPSNGLFVLDYDGDGQFTAADKAYSLGVGIDPTDVPVVGDWNGSGTTKVGLFRQGFLWILDANGNGVFEQGIDKTYAFGGVAGDIPVVGDWTGSGTSKIGLFRLGFYWILDANGNGVLDNINGTGGDQAFAYGGIADDIPVVGDWNGSGTSKVGVFRSGFFWVLDANGNHTFDGTGSGQDLAFPFGGITGDVPVAGQW